MNLLENASQGVLENGISLDSESRNLLVEASLELIHFTNNLEFPLPQVDKCLKAYRKVEFNELFTEKQLENLRSRKFPLWMRWLANSFDCFQNAIINSQFMGNIEASKELRNIYETIRRLLDISILSGKNAQTHDRLISLICTDSTLLKEGYLQLAIIPPYALSRAIAWEIIFQRNIPIEVKGAELLPDIAFEFWDKADEKARCSRQSNRLADILSAANECYLWYYIAKQLLQMSISLYEEARVSVPTELHKEHQVIEELRVAMAETLCYCGGNFVSFSVLHAFLGSQNAPLRQALTSGIDNAVANNPLYPNILAESLREFIDQYCNLQNNSKIVVSRKDWTLESKIRKEMSERFQSCFSDNPVATVSQRICDRWFNSKH